MRTITIAGQRYRVLEERLVRSVWTKPDGTQVVVPYVAVRAELCEWQSQSAQPSV